MAAPAPPSGRLSLWTSRIPLELGVTKNGWKVFKREGSESQTRLFAEMLRDGRNTTAAFVSANPVKSYTGPTRPQNRSTPPLPIAPSYRNS